ncbi:MAG TPA: leucine--tRNA ligase [Thermoplasmata archaeon]|jgi:leucyl-tRNA synthetase|nr:MAG TPA: leucine--tRNA ligase [Thermoplasmata archaeon]
MEENNYDYVAVEQKWQDNWFEANINVARREKNKKFFIHFAYPGVSGYLHVGHMRGFTYCDVIARYKRMTGYDVLFPAGFHASGIPSVGFAKKVERQDPDTIRLLKQNGCTPECIKRLTDPIEVINYFSKVYVDDYWKRFGFFIDYTRLMNTISDGYKKFIQWQFHKLHDKKLLIQKPHYAPYCPNCGPVAVDKSETDVSQGGSAEILDFTVLKFTLNDGTILPAATLRPETIFGVTNMWVNPTVEYHTALVNSETWICSKECIQKLSYQYDHVKPLDKTIIGKDLIGKTCIVPETNREVPILAGVFADPSVATGIVMSVPAHAPYDWIALVESKENIEAIKIIDVKGFGNNPAKEACDQLGIKSQTETEKLNEATDLVYKKEFHTGVLNGKCGKYAGIKISEIKDTVKNDLIQRNLAATMKEFSEPVICRCKENVVIKQIPDQWFIKYSDAPLTQESKDYAATMNIYPPEYKDELPKILDWFGDRAAIRLGSWLGTEFPYKKDWIIEPISDSTLYPAYYVISSYVNQKKIAIPDMTDAFFDYVFLGIGSPKDKIWQTIKSDFDYWYPVDINLGGKEHKTVHFPVYIMNHVAIMPEQKRPQGIFVHWWVTQKGKEKISKSKGGAEPIVEAAVTYGVDAMRLYYLHIGSPFVDIEWDPETVLKYKNRIINIWRLVGQIALLKDGKQENLDNWLKSSLQRRIKKILTAFEALDLRVASNEIYFELQKDLQWYLKRGGANQKLLHHFVRSWIVLMTPITPHLAEEFWITQGQKQFVSNEPYPEFNSKDISEKDEVGEYLLNRVIDDTIEIMNVTKIAPKKICIYTSPAWKQKIFRKAIASAAGNNFNVGSLIKETLVDPAMKSLGQQVSQFVAKIAPEIKTYSEIDRARFMIPLDEKKHLSDAKTYLTDALHCPVEIYSADDADLNDPAKKIKFATPLRPAIYIE